MNEARRLKQNIGLTGKISKESTRRDNPANDAAKFPPLDCMAIARMAAERVQTLTPPPPSDKVLIVRCNFMSWIAAANACTAIGQKSALREAVRALADLHDESLCHRLLKEQWRDSSPGLQRQYEKMVAKHLHIGPVDWQISKHNQSVQCARFARPSFKNAAMALGGTIAASVVSAFLFFNDHQRHVANVSQVVDIPSVPLKQAEVVSNLLEITAPAPISSVHFTAQRSASTTAEMTFRNLGWIRSANLPMTAPPQAWITDNWDNEIIELIPAQVEEFALSENLRLADAAFGPNSTASVDPLEALAQFFMTHARYREAEPLLKRLLTLKETQVGSSHISLIPSLDYLGQIYFQSQNYALARDTFQRVLQIKSAYPNLHHGSLATSLENLALAEMWMGQSHESKERLGKVLSLRQSELGAEHPDIASCFDHLGMASLCEADVLTARKYFQRSVEIREKAFGANHPQIIPSLCCLAILSCAERDFGASEDLFRRIVTVSELNFGIDAVFTADCLNNLAKVRLMRSERSDAESLFQRVAKIRLEKLGPNHESTKLSQEVVRQTAKRD